MLMPASEPVAKRVVFVRPDGLHQICGVSEPGETLPVCIGPFATLGETVEFASQYRVTTRAVYFKAPTIPGSGQTLHEAQQ